jgi:succinyl-CoA synthetase beta subunit
LIWCIQRTRSNKVPQINESGLKIFSIDDLQTAAEKSVQFSKVVKMARDIDVGVEFNLGI